MPLNAEEQALIGKVDELHNDLDSLLVELVRAESVNPPGDTRRAMGVLRSQLEAVTPEVQEVGFRPEAPNLLTFLNPGGRPQLLFNSHLDTVPIGDRDQWRHDPFGGEIKDGLLYGRGAADAKGCVAAMVMAARALKESQVSLRGELVVNAVSEEETGGLQGTKWLVDNGYLQPDAVVIGEITRNRVAISHKGIVWLRLITHGRTAHASTPWEGTNAIVHMVRILHRIDAELRPEVEARRHPLTPAPSINFGLVSGGVKTNVVADRCEAEIDRRVLPGESPEEAIAEFKAVIEDVAREIPELRAELETMLVGSPLETSSDADIVRQATSAARDLGIPSEPEGYQQASDGRFFGERGVPTILIGPGVPEVAHTPNEHLDLAALHKAARMYALTAYRFLR